MNRGNFSIDPDEEMKRNCCGTLGRGFDDFSRADLRDIILHKNKVIADLEEHAYGSASWIENLNKGLKRANEIKKNAPPKESDEDFRKRLEGFDREKDAPTENWGADELNGGATPAEPKVSPVAAAAAVLQPVRTAIQNGIGDAIYGKSDDPKKQKKGLLGISEEGKEESKKKVMKNIVVPIVKAANQLKTNIEDTANQIFNKDKYDADMKERRIKQIKKEEAEAGIVRDKENPMIIIRKPRGMWKADTTDPTEEAYNRKRVLKWNRGAKTQEETDKEVYYIRVPNPIFAAKLKPSFKEFGDAGVKLWTGVEQLKKGESEDVDGTLKQLQDDPFIFIPEDRAKEIYGQLRQFVADKQDEGVMEGYEDEGWTKGQLKAFAKIDPRTLKGQDLIDWKESKLALDKVTTQNALDKVKKDIKDEEAKATPDQTRLGKMREAKVRVENRQKELSVRGQQEFKDMMMFSNAEKAKRDAEYYARQKADAEGAINEADADKAEFDAKPVAERIAILESYKEDSEGQTLFDLDEQIEQLRAQEASEKVEQQAQGSVDLLQQAQVIGAEGGAKPCWKGYEMIGMKQKGKRTVPNCVPIGNGMWEDEAELEGAGAVEYTLNKAGMRLFNPSGDMSKAARQSFTPDYEAYGETMEQGRLNAFNLSRSMYDQTKAIELPDFKLIQDDTSLRFYRKEDDDVILVGIRGTDVNSWTDLYTWAVIGVSADLRMTTRFQEDLAKLVAFQRNYPPSQFYYVGTGSSLAGSIADRFLELGLLEEAITYNPSIEKKHLLDENILNHRVYLDTDPLFILMGQYSPNTEIRVNPNKTNYYNPSKEKDYLIKSHSIYPVYNPAFEGGGMEGSGKTYTLEEWKAIFDAKLEQKRKAIEAREAKKKQTAKAKRERAKGRRDEREKPKEPEPEPELEVTQFTIDGQIILVEDDDAGEKRFLDRRVFNDDSEEIGTLGSLTPEKLRKLVVERVQRAEKRGEFAKEVVFSEDEEDDDDDEPPPLEAPFRTSRVQKATPPKGEPKKRKPRFKIVAPASARVELREELVAEQPRTEQGKFAEQAETAVVAVSQAPQRAYMKLMKSPIFTDTERRLLTRIRETKMTPRMRAVLLGRSGLARKVMEMLGLDESAFQTPRARARIADKMEKRVATKATAYILPKIAQDFIETQFAFAIKKVAEMRKSNVAPSKTVGFSYVGEPETHPHLTKKQIIEWEDGAIRWIGNGTKFGLGSIEVVKNAFKEDPFGMWYCGAEIKLHKVKEPPASHTKSHTLQLVCEMTRKQDEDLIIRAELDNDALVFNTTDRFALVKLTRAMLGALKEDGVRCSQGVNKGIMKKQSTYWSCDMVGTSEVKKWTEAENQRWLMIGKTDILPKLEERIAGLRPLFESATENAREKAEKALRPNELKMLLELRAERKKEADETARKNSKLLQDAGARLKRYKENYWMTGMEAMKGDPFQQQSRKLEHYFIDELGNRVVLGLEWGGLDNYKLNQLWRDFNRMDEATDPDPRNVDYKQMSAARDIMAINPENNKPRLVGIGVERADGSVFIPASYIHDWVYNSVSLAERGRVGREGYSNWHTDNKKPTNAEEDDFYGAMVQTVRRTMRNATFQSYGLAIHILPQMVARFSDWTQSKAKRGKWEEEWDANPEAFMKEAFGKAFDLE